MSEQIRINKTTAERPKRRVSRGRSPYSEAENPTRQPNNISQTVADYAKIAGGVRDPADFLGELSPTPEEQPKHDPTNKQEHDQQANEAK